MLAADELQVVLLQVVLAERIAALAEARQQAASSSNRQQRASIRR